MDGMNYRDIFVITKTRMALGQVPTIPNFTEIIQIYITTYMPQCFSIAIFIDH